MCKGEGRQQAFLRSGWYKDPVSGTIVEQPMWGFTLAGCRSCSEHNGRSDKQIMPTMATMIMVVWYNCCRIIARSSLPTRTDEQKASTLTATRDRMLSITALISSSLRWRGYVILQPLERIMTRGGGGL
jgi:hypothetical protein